MNLRRFQFAVNHQDPRVVLAGLKEFFDQLCEAEQKLSRFFRPAENANNEWSADDCADLLPCDYPNAQETLETFLDSSPQAEEFFSLWSFPTIEYDSELCAMDMDCLAALIECLPKSSSHLLSIINRINSSSAKFILFQLEKKNASLRISVLRLLIAVQRKGRLSTDILHPLLLTNLAKGEQAERKSDASADELYFAAKLFFSILLLGDTDHAQQLLSHGPNTDSLINSLLPMSTAAYSLFLSGLFLLLEHGARIQDALMQKLFNSATVQKLLAAGAESVAKLVLNRQFLEKFVDSTAAHKQSNKPKSIRTSLSSYHARKFLGMIVTHLDPVSHPVHAKIQLKIAQAVPEMYRRCLQSIKISWEPMSSDDYLIGVHHVVNLLTTVDARSKAFVSSESIHTLCLHALGLPPGLGKQELTKIINHPAPKTRLAGLTLLRAVMHRLEIVLADPDARKTEALHASQEMLDLLASKLPEVGQVLALRPRLLAEYNASKREDGAALNSSAPSQSSQPPPQAAMEVDIELNLDFGDQEIRNAGEMRADERSSADSLVDRTRKTENHVAPAVVALLDCVGSYYRIFPSACSALRHDLPKLLDELYSRSIDSSEPAPQKDSTLEDRALHRSLLALLSESTRLCNWFGTDEENTKLLNNILVQADWQAVSTKRFALSRLVQHGKEGSEEEGTQRFLFRLLATDSGLFDGHSLYDLDLHSEAKAWIACARDTRQVVLLEALIRLTITWNVELCTDLFPHLAKQSHRVGISPVLYCAVCLLTGHWKVFVDRLPKFFQAYLTPERVEQGSADAKLPEQRAAFFSKYMSSFAMPLLSLLEQVVPQIMVLTTDPQSWLQLLDGLCSTASSPPIYREALQSHVRALQRARTVPMSLPAMDSSRMEETVAKLPSFAEALVHVAVHLRAAIDQAAKQPLASRLQGMLRDHWPFLASLHLSYALHSCKKDKTSSGLLSVRVLDWLAGKWRSTASIVNGYSPEHRLAALPFAALVHQLALLDGILGRQMRRAKAAEQTSPTDSSTACFMLSDLLCEMALQTCRDAGATPRLIEQAVGIPLLRESLFKSNAFGMICRRILISCLPALHSSDSLSYLDTVARQWLQLHVSSPFDAEDPSFLDLATALVETRKLAQHQELNQAVLALQLQSPSTLLTSLLVPSTPSPESWAVPLVANRTALLQAINPTQAVSLFQRWILSETADSQSLAIVGPLVAIGQDRTQYFQAIASIDASTVVLQAMDIAVPRGRQGLGLVRACAQIVRSQGQTTTALLSSAAISTAGHAILWFLMRGDENLSLDSLAGAQYVAAYPRVHQWLLAVCGQRSSLSEALKEVMQAVEHCLPPIRERLVAQLVCDAANDFESAEYGDLFLQLSSFAHCALPASVITFYMRESLSLVKDKDAPHSDDRLRASLRRVVRAVTTSEELDSLQLTKWLRVCWKFRLEDAAVQEELRSLLQHAVRMSEEEEAKVAWRDLVLESLRLLCTHTRTETLLQTQETQARRIRIAFLQNVLILLPCAISHHPAEVVEVTQALRRELANSYAGSMNLYDRIALRILWLFQMQSRSLEGLLVILPPSGKASSLHAWLFNQVKPARVYATIAAFPQQRGLVPTPFAWEIWQPQKMKIDSFQGEEQTYPMNLLHAMGLTEPEAAAQNRDWDDASSSAGNAESLSDVYDPSYFLPLILHALHSEPSTSLKGLVNGGILSLLLIALSSQSTALRTIALASLQHVWTAIHSEEAEKDKSFRERVQIRLLLGFVRNSIASGSSSSSAGGKEGSEEGLDIVSTALPSLSAQFLGRAALQIMSPLHALYGKTNRYLINRLYLDVKDVPLWELLFIQTESREEGIQALRFVRDGLRSHADHLNLCRKHVYTRLLLLFPIYLHESRDMRFGQALLDVWSQALTLREAAHYLLDKCHFLPWIAHTFRTVWDLACGSSSSSLERGGEMTSETTAGGGGGGRPGSGQGAVYLSRLLHLFQRCVSAVYLLCQEGTVQPESLLASLRSALQDILRCLRPLSLSSLMGWMSGEILDGVVKCLWEFSALCRVLHRSEAFLPSSDILAAVRHLMQLAEPRTSGSSARLAVVLILGLTWQGAVSPFASLAVEQVVEVFGWLQRLVFWRLQGSVQNEESASEACAQLRAFSSSLPSLSSEALSEPLPSASLYLANAMFLVHAHRHLHTQSDGNGGHGDEAWQWMAQVCVEREAAAAWPVELLHQPGSLDLVLWLATESLRVLWPTLPETSHEAFQATHKLIFHCVGLDARPSAAVVLAAQCLFGDKSAESQDVVRQLRHRVVSNVAANLAVCAEAMELTRGSPLGVDPTRDWSHCTRPQLATFVRSVIAGKPALGEAKAAERADKDGKRGARIRSRSFETNESRTKRRKRRRINLRPGLRLL